MNQPPGKAGAIQPVQVQLKLKGGVLLGSECCVAIGDSGCEAYRLLPGLLRWYPSQQVWLLACHGDVSKGQTDAYDRKRHNSPSAVPYAGDVQIAPWRPVSREGVAKSS